MRADHPLKGMAWMVTGVRLLSVMDALSKQAVSQLSILVLIAARSVMVLVLLVPLVLLMAVLVLLGQRCTFWAFQLAPVGVVAPFHYSELL